MKKYNILSGVILLVIAIGAYLIAAPMVAKLPTDPLGPAWWPKGLSALMALFSVLLILQGIFTPKEKDTKPPIDFHSEGFRRVAKLCGVLIIFAGVVYFLGIYVGLMLMVPTVMYLLGERNIKIIIPFTLGVCVFVYVVFKLLLMVPLPTGMLFD